MSMEYADWKPLDLLEALELAGSRPDPALISACLSRGAELVPGLVDMMSRGTQLHWEPDDPRWYRDAHAGLLLIALRAPEAIPLFDVVLRDPEREALVDEWFEAWLPLYGETLVPVLADVATDATVYPGGRETAVRLLGVIGEQFPGTRPHALAVLRPLLPPLRDDGSLALPRRPEETTADQIELWSHVVSSLETLRDDESRDRVVALFEAGLLDEEVVGELGDYLEALTEPLSEPPEEMPDLVQFYENLDAWSELSDSDLVDTLRDAMLEAGFDAREADAVRVEMLTALHEDFDDEEDIGVQALETLATRLRAAGIPEEELGAALDAAVSSVLRDSPAAASAAAAALIVLEHPETGEQVQRSPADAEELLRSGWRPVPPAGE